LGRLSQFFLKSGEPVSKPGPVRSPVRYPPSKTRSGSVTGGPSSQKTRSGAVPGVGTPKKNRSGVVTGGPPRSTGTGDRDRTRWPHLWTRPRPRNIYAMQKSFFLFHLFFVVARKGGNVRCKRWKESTIRIAIFMMLTCLASAH